MALLESDSSNIHPLAKDFYRSVTCPADVVYNFVEDANLLAAATTKDNVFEIPLYDAANNNVNQKQHPSQAQGIEDAFVIPNVLSHKDCDEWIRLAEEDGIVPPLKEAGTLRTAKRTDRYQNSSFSTYVQNCIESTVLSQLTNTKRWGEFHSVHPNWRILRYDPQDSFPAHQDQMDSFQVYNKSSGTKDLIVSTHTMLINLSDVPTVKGGATRFYPLGGIKMKKSTKNQNDATTSDGANAAESINPYEYAVDICLPRGWALVFPQLGMLHAGQPVEQGHKYVAQAGILRTLPPGQLIRPSVFKLGPGLRGL